VKNVATKTIQLRTYIENFTILEADNETGIPYPLEKRIEIGRQHLFDFDYPFFDEKYKPIFERNFIEYFYMREIGFETMGLFKLRLRSWLRSHMTYYNKLWESTLIEFDPLINTDRKIESTKQADRFQEDATRKNIIFDEVVSDDENENVSRETSEQNTTDVDSQSHTTGRSVSDSDVNENSQTSTNTSGNNQSNSTENGFNRVLESNTPDDRLQLTSNADGSGTIEYATKITEDKNTGTNQTTGSNASEQKQNRLSSTNSHDISDTNTQTTADQLQQFQGSENEGIIRNKQRSQNRDNSQDETGNLSSNINDVEDYVYHTMGKIGVQSYSKMIMEFRESIINIELQVFEDMQELFMLVYTI